MNAGDLFGVNGVGGRVVLDCWKRRVEATAVDAFKTESLQVPPHKLESLKQTIRVVTAAKL